MVLLRSFIFSLTLSQLLVYISSVVSQKMTYQEKAYLLSEAYCHSVNDRFTAPPVLLAAAQLVLLGKTVEIVSPMQGQYSMKVDPKCIMKGNTKEKEIIVHNLGKTKCGSSNVEIGYNYLFFLRKTSDPQTFYALNSGVKYVATNVLWTDIFVLLCGVGRRLMCKLEECPAACNYSPPKEQSCIIGNQTVHEIFRSVFPNGPPTTTHKMPTTTHKMPTTTHKMPTTTHKTSTTVMPKTHVPQTNKVTSTHKPSTQKVTTASSESALKTTTMPKVVTDKITSDLKVTASKTTTSTYKASTGGEANIPNTSTRRPKSTIAPSIELTLTTSGAEEMTEETNKSLKTEAKDHPKQDGVMPYTPINNTTVKVQQSKSNQNGQGNLYSNERFVILTIFVLFFLRS